MHGWVGIAGVGIIAPGVTSLSHLGARVARAGPSRIETVPLPARLRERDVRRLARLTRFSLFAAESAFRDAGLEGDETGVMVGLTHGTTSYLKEFHDYLYDYGAEMASPNAFANGVTNAPLGSISKQLGVTGGGMTVVGYEDCGLDVIGQASRAVLRGDYRACLAGAAEEYSPIVEGAYKAAGWFSGAVPGSPRDCGGTRELSEGSAFCLLVPPRAGLLCLAPVDDPRHPGMPVDAVVSGAGGGPQDPFEFDVLRDLAPSGGVVYPKQFLGEAFAAAGVFAVALAVDMLLNGTPYPVHPHPGAAGLFGASRGGYSSVNRILVIAAGRTGSLSAVIVARIPC